MEIVIVWHIKLQIMKKFKNKNKICDLGTSYVRILKNVVVQLCVLAAFNLFASSTNIRRYG